MRKALRYLPWVLLVIIVLAASCVVSSSGLRENSGGTRQVTPCIASTGERDYGMVVVTGFPDAAQPGDTLQIAFSGGYYDILPSCELRGGQYYYHYPTLTELSSKARTVEVYLDAQKLASVECGYECSIQFLLPTNVATGMHKILVRPSSWGYKPRDAEFGISVRNKE